MKKLLSLQQVLSIVTVLVFVSCGVKNAGPSKEVLSAINLKTGDVISCGPADKQFGSVVFDVSGSEDVKKDFNLAVKLLHSFEYDEAEKVFAKVIAEAPGCAMAYWGAAMCNYHPLWTPPLPAELKKGAALVSIAQSIEGKTKREAGYIDALASFYKDWDKTDHRTRSINFEKGMEKVYAENPTDKEAAVFYALALDAAADPADKSFRNQKKAGSILYGLYPGEPNHPGIVHYIIHTYDYPELAELALPAARKYAAVAPSSAHALHMPSHIFTRLGLWDDCIRSNLVSVDAAKCYAITAGIKGHWDEELHGMDYLVYGYLQKGANDLAKAQWDSLVAITAVSPVNFKVAYAYAAIPSRYLLENKSWPEAAQLQLHPRIVPWKNFPWQSAIVHFARLLGAVHTKDIAAAKTDLKKLYDLRDTLLNQKDAYKANQVNIQATTGAAWIQFANGNNAEALKLMNLAADMEDKTEKHPVTPGEVIPARELLGDMLLQMNKPAEALAAYEAGLQKHPNRFNALYGAGLTAEKAGNIQSAISYYTQLLAITGKDNNNRSEVVQAKVFVEKHKHG
jgi:tetratricopeptide (TPR) repeat protein